MFYRKSMVVAGWVCLGLNALACSSGRDVEVSGKVSAPSSLMVGDRLVVDFMDVTGEGEERETSVAHSAELKTLGDFKETVSLEGDTVLVRAIDDRDGDGKCSAGEAWGEAEASIADDKVEAISLTLASAACPAAAE
jgi:hypothetical protein